MKNISLLSPLKGISCAVLGLGISNLPLIDTLLNEGAVVTARDLKDRGRLGKIADTLEARGVRLVLGEDYLENLTEQVIFRSPGIRPDAGDLTLAIESGAILTSEVEFFCEHTPARIIAITGSDGKTTTSTLTSLILKEGYKGGKIYLGGNIGTPLPDIECGHNT